jgi:hypothetical protein
MPERLAKARVHHINSAHMKYRSLIIVGTALMLIAAGCKSQPVSETNSNTQVQTPSNQNTNQTGTTANNNQANQSDQASGKNVFVDSVNKINLNYNGLNMVTNTPGSYIPAQSNFGDDGTDVSVLYLDPSIYKGTNLESAWFNLAINSKLDSKGCYAKLTYDSSLSAFTQKRIVQGNTWYYPTPNPTEDAGAGHQGLFETYRLFKNNLCYEARLGLSKFTRENLENPNSIKEIDVNKTFGELGAVFNKLQVN